MSLVEVQLVWTLFLVIRVNCWPCYVTPAVFLCADWRVSDYCCLWSHRQTDTRRCWLLSVVTQRVTHCIGVVLSDVRQDSRVLYMTNTVAACWVELTRTSSCCVHDTLCRDDACCLCAIRNKNTLLLTVFLHGQHTLQLCVVTIHSALY